MPTLLAPAKINVTLEILSRRSDGYHTLRSVMVPIGLYDRIAIEPSQRDANSFAVADVALANDNLVMRALDRCAPERRFDVRLDKQTPVGGGLGGGSSDAAAVLRHAMAGGLGSIGPVDWNAVASSLGSDVPFFLCGTAALVEGTGERVTPLGALPPWWVVVVRPHVSVATAEAYASIARSREAGGSPPSRPRAESASLAAVDALQRADFDALQRALVNDFDEPIRAAYPAVANAADALGRAAAMRPLLSGSGSCVFALFANEASARATASALDPAVSAATFVVPFHHDAAWR